MKLFKISLLLFLFLVGGKVAISDETDMGFNKCMRKCEVACWEATDNYGADPATCYGSCLEACSS